MKRIFWVVLGGVALAVAVKVDRLRRDIDRVVIVTIDTVRADHLPFYGYPRPTASAFNTAIEEGYVFRRAYASSPDAALALRSLSTARHPFDAASPSAVPLLEILRDGGFEASAFSDAPDFGVIAGRVPFEPAPDVMAAAEQAGRWIRDKARQKKVAVWLHLDGRLAPAADKKLDRLAPIGPELRRYLAAAQGLGDESLPRVRAHDNQIRFVDRAASRFFNLMMNRRKPTILVVAGVRGAALDGNDDGLRVDEGMIRVPLIVWFSDDRGPGRRMPGLVRHIDIWPTIAGLALPLHRRVMLNAGGRSFAGSLRRAGGWSGTAPAYVERASGSAALVSGRRKLVKIGDGYRLYDLIRDPLERVDLSAADPGGLERMRRRLERFNRTGR